MIRDAFPPDFWHLLRLRKLCWPDVSDADLRRQIEGYFLNQDDRYRIIVVEAKDGTVCGFVEVSLDDLAEREDPQSGYARIEGLQVACEDSQNNQCLCASLLDAAEKWVLQQRAHCIGAACSQNDAMSLKTYIDAGFRVRSAFLRLRKDLPDQAV